MIDLDDPRTGKIADVISNKTAKKILGLLSNSELSESEISNNLKLPLNTIEYNIRKLEESGLIDKTKRFLWSIKGKRIYKYRISNKKIVISPRRMMRGIIPSVLISGAIAFGIKIWTDSKLEKAADVVGGEQMVRGLAMEKSAEASSFLAADAGVNDSIMVIAQNVWLLFFAGALFALLVFLILNFWRKR